MAGRHQHDAARAACKAMFLAARGSISDPGLSRAMVAAGHGKFSIASIGEWRRKGRWLDALAPVGGVATINRAARGHEIGGLILDKGGEVMLLEGVYGEMLLASAQISTKLLAWANGLDVTTLKPGDAVDIIKAMPALVDRATKLKETLNDLKWRGSAAALTDKGDPDALNGEVLPPEGQKGQPSETERTERTPEPEQSVQPALSDALANIAKARKAAPNLVRDVAPKARASIR